MHVMETIDHFFTGFDYRLNQIRILYRNHLKINADLRYGKITVFSTQSEDHHIL